MRFAAAVLAALIVPALHAALEAKSIDVEIGFNQVSEIVAQPSVDLVGPLPAPIQSYTTLSIGVLSHAANPEAARRLADFLASPEVAAVMTRKGFERP